MKARMIVVYDVIIIGAGAAGLMAAVKALEKSKVLVIEKNISAGKKLLITGGGRCNLTNLKENNIFLEEVKYNKKFLYSAINKFGPQDIFAYFSNLNQIPLKEEEDNKIFPKSGKSVDILNVLLENSEKAEFRYEEEVQEIINEKVKKVVTNRGIYKTKNIIIATGGLSFPQTGSSGDNLKFAKMIDQPIVDIFPAEASIATNNNKELAGTTVEEVVVKFGEYKFSGNLMFTHKGLSGSAIMKASEHIYKENIKQISLDLIPYLTKDELIHELQSFDREKETTTFLLKYFTKRLSNYLVERGKLSKKIKSLTKTEIEILINLVKNFATTVKSVASVQEAFVTGGGIDMNYINSSTMESKICPGIYFVGEALDIHGPIGGYNITLALSTGYLAGSSIKLM